MGADEYRCDGRPMTPTAIGYYGAAFYRYRARYGADVDNRIEFYPSRQWGLLADDAADLALARLERQP